MRSQHISTDTAPGRPLCARRNARLTVAEVVAPHPASKVGGTLIAYAVLYAFLLTSYILTLRYMGTKPAKSLRMLEPHREPLVTDR